MHVRCLGADAPSEQPSSVRLALLAVGETSIAIHLDRSSRRLDDIDLVVPTAGSAEGCASIVIAGYAPDAALAAYSAFGGARMAPGIAVCDAMRRPGIQRLVAAGIKGIVLTEQVGVTLRATIHAVIAGQIFVPPITPPPVQQQALSARERQVLG